jgi:hypothetical protein
MKRVSSEVHRERRHLKVQPPFPTGTAPRAPERFHRSPQLHEVSVLITPIREEEEKRTRRDEAVWVSNGVSGYVVVDARRPSGGSVGPPQRRVLSAVACGEKERVMEWNEPAGVGVNQSVAAHARRPREREDIWSGLQVDDEFRVLRSPIRRPELGSVPLGVGRPQFGRDVIPRRGLFFRRPRSLPHAALLTRELVLFRLKVGQERTETTI